MGSLPSVAGHPPLRIALWPPFAARGTLGAKLSRTPRKDGRLSSSHVRLRALVLHNAGRRLLSATPSGGFDMTIATFTDALPTAGAAASADVSREVMSRITSQVLAMGQLSFERILERPQEENYDYEDVPDDEGEEQ